MKKSVIIFVTAILSAAILSACGSESNSTAAPATADEASYAQAATVATLGETDQAVVDAGLTVDSKGNVVDKDGNKVKQTSDGKVEVKTADGKTVTVNAAQVKTANENKEKTDAANQASAQNTNGSAQSGQINQSSQTSKPAQSSQSSQTSKPAQSSQSSQTSKPAQSSQSSQTNKPAQSSQSSQTSKPAQSSQSSQTSKPAQSSQSSQTQPTTVDPHAGKTYHEAVYKTVNHPAETKQVKVVDQEAYSYEEPVYEMRRIHKCKDCGMDLLQLSADERYAHAEAHMDEGGDGGWYSTTEQVQVGTKTINVPEKSHMETVVVKAAWTEKVLVKEAGWY